MRRTGCLDGISESDGPADIRAKEELVMDFDLYAAGPEPMPPAIPNLIWDRQSDGTFVASFEFVYSRMWDKDRERLEMIGFGLKPEGRYGSRVHFDPTVVSTRTVTEVLEGLYSKHAAYIADRARIDAGHADRHRRIRGAVERGRSVLERFGPAHVGCGRVRTILEQVYKTDSALLELDRLCTKIEAKAAK